MALITLNEVRTLLQINNSDYDDLIVAMLPIVRDFVVDYCHNQFLTDHYIYASTIAFVNGTPATITDSDSDFVESYLTNATDIHVGNSLYNDGYYKVASVAAGTITLANGETLKTEAADDASPIIHEVAWPKGLKPIVAGMIDSKINKIGKGVLSETIGGYSVSYDTNYPKYITDQLNVYRSLWQ